MTSIDNIIEKHLVAFCPKAGATYSGNVTVVETTAVKLWGNVTITIIGAAIEYLKGEVVIFVAGVTYVFSASTPVHIMK